MPDCSRRNYNYKLAVAYLSGLCRGQPPVRPSRQLAIMVRMTLRQWLNQPMPHPFTMVASALMPSTHESAETIDGWTRWEDFNIEAINALLGRVLDKTCELPVLGTSFHAAHAVIGSEDALRWAVAQWSAKIVNVALEAVSAASDYYLVRGPGGACRSSSSRLHPDWSSVLSSSRLYDRTNFIAGESKMLPKDFPISFSSGQTSGLAEMERKRKSCLEQVVGYARAFNTRYGYLLGPYELVVIRVRTDPPIPADESLAQTRPRRAAAQPPSSVMPSTPPRPAHYSPGALRTPGSAQTESYPNSPRQGLHVAPLEVAVIPWQLDSKDARAISVNLAVFVLHLLAKFERHWKSRYDDINEDDVYRRGAESLRGG